MNKKYELNINIIEKKGIFFDLINFLLLIIFSNSHFNF